MTTARDHMLMAHLTLEEYQSICKLAEKQDISVSALIRRALGLYQAVDLGEAEIFWKPTLKKASHAESILHPQS